MESVVALASLVDKECQDYGAFTLAFLANNKSFQVPLVKMEGVRPLVSMMATNSESKPYAALALLKLADNFENHVTITGESVHNAFIVFFPSVCLISVQTLLLVMIIEEGGINALLKLGKSKISNEKIKYKAFLSVGQMAANAVTQSNLNKGKVRCGVMVA